MLFGKTKNGKPVIASRSEPLSFNLAHTKDIALIAVSTGAAVGIDIESSTRQFHDLPTVIGRCCTERERKRLIDMSTDGAGNTHMDRLMSNFLQLWTCKEAFVKCTGEGIARGLKTFEVSTDRETPRITTVDGDAKIAGKWTAHDVPVEQDFIATLVAATSNELLVHHIDWNSTNDRHNP